jgi:hypothetical protein
MTPQKPFQKIKYFLLYQQVGWLTSYPALCLTKKKSERAQRGNRSTDKPFFIINMPANCLDSLIRAVEILMDINTIAPLPLNNTDADGPLDLSGAATKAERERLVKQYNEATTGVFPVFDDYTPKKPAAAAAEGEEEEEEEEEEEVSSDSEYDEEEEVGGSPKDPDSGEEEAYMRGEEVRDGEEEDDDEVMVEVQESSGSSGESEEEEEEQTTPPPPPPPPVLEKGRMKGKKMCIR